MNRQTVTAAARQSWPKQPMYRVRNFGQGSLDMNGKLQFQWRKTTSVGLAATGCCSAAQDPTRFPSSLRRDVVSLALLRGVRLVPLRKGNKTDRESTRAKRATRIWWWFCKVCTAARLVGLWQQAGGERDRERAVEPGEGLVEFAESLHVDGGGGSSRGNQRVRVNDQRPGWLPPQVSQFHSILHSVLFTCNGCPGSPAARLPRRPSRRGGGGARGWRLESGVARDGGRDDTLSPAQSGVRTSQTDTGCATASLSKRALSLTTSDDDESIAVCTVYATARCRCRVQGRSPVSKQFRKF